MASPDENAKGTNSEQSRRYWRINLTLIAVLLAIWFAVSFVCGVLLVEPLNEFHIGGFPLGFWMAQQGSIYVFVVLILIYCLVMEREDRKFHVGQAPEAGQDSSPKGGEDQ